MAVPKREKLKIAWRVIKYSPILEAFTIADRISTTAKLTGFSRNTVGKVVKEFVELGLLERNGSKVRLTPKGETILEELRRLDEALTLSPTSPSEVVKR